MAFAIYGKSDIQLSVSKLPLAVYLIFHARLNANMKKEDNLGIVLLWNKNTIHNNFKFCQDFIPNFSYFSLFS